MCLALEASWVGSSSHHPCWMWEFIPCLIGIIKNDSIDNGSSLIVLIILPGTVVFLLCASGCCSSGLREKQQYIYFEINKMKMIGIMIYYLTVQKFKDQVDVIENYGNSEKRFPHQK